MTSLKEQLFTGCAAKTCCEVDTVFPTAIDTVRIARMLDVSPAAFTATEAAEAGDPDAFRLAQGPVRVTLAHRAQPDGEAGGCIFLLRLPDGSGRCSLGDDRPTPCLAFPCVLQEGVIAMGGESCTCRAWSLGDVDPAQERSILETEAAQRAAHRATVERWNAGPRAITATFGDLVAYLMAEAVH